MTEYHDRSSDGGLSRGHSCKQEPGDILRRKLNPQGCSEGIETKDMQIFVEVAQPRQQRDRFNTGVGCALCQNGVHHIPSYIGIAGDVEPTQARWKEHS